jgi:hypothetical protein
MFFSVLHDFFQYSNFEKLFIEVISLTKKAKMVLKKKLRTVSAARKLFLFVKF